MRPATLAEATRRIVDGAPQEKALPEFLDTFYLAPTEEQKLAAISERPVDTTYVKNYDEIHGEGPTQWARRFDISNWGFIRARSKSRLVGGAVVAFNTGNVAMLEGRRDLAVLWDIRVSPDVRGKGVGFELLRASEAWAVSKGCRQLKVETQNINVQACKFYEAHGFVLRVVDRLAYPELPGEIQFLWYKDLSADSSTNGTAG